MSAKRALWSAAAAPTFVPLLLLLLVRPCAPLSLLGPRCAVPRGARCSLVCAATAPTLPDAAPRAASPVISPAKAIRGLYDAFNARDADAAASFLADDCVYEDLLLGPWTVCRCCQPVAESRWK